MFARVLAAVVIVGTAIIAFIVAWPQLVGLQVAPVIAQAVSFRGAATAAAFIVVLGMTLVALVFAKARRFAGSIALILLAFALVNLAVLSTRGIGDPSFTTKSESDLTVLTWNTLGDAPGADAIAQLALDEDADIIALPETTEALGVEIATLMKQGGKPMWVHTVAYDLVSKARSTTLLISAELGDYAVDESVRTTSTLPSVVARPVDGTGPTVIAVHPVAPVPGELANWRSDLDWLASTCVGDNVVMAGDFNSTSDHWAGLGSAAGRSIGECLDAGTASNNAAVGTWPTFLPALLGAPIDHVLFTDNWRVTGMRVIQSLDGLGSDHRPVVAQLTPAG